MFWATLRMALLEIRRNVLRSALTMLGIVIGVGAVIVLVSLGQGTTAQVTADIGKMGKNLLMVFPGSGFRRQGAATAASPFELADAVALGQVQGVAAVAPTASAEKLVVYGNQNLSATITGTTSAYLGIRDLQLESGVALGETDQQGGLAVCLLGATVKDELFGRQAALGESVRVGNMSCRVTGVLAAKGRSAGGPDQDSVVLMPLSTFQRRIGGSHDVGAIFLSAAEGVGTARVQERVEELLRERRRVAPGAEDNFSVRDTAEIVKAVTAATGSLTALLGAIAAVSLVVGGIGIMNIMLVTVTERTREIGIRIAIGALGREVLLQFLVEAVVLSLLGGALGVGLGVLGAYLASGALRLPFVVSSPTIGLAFAVSAFIGVVFGYLPARKAARLEPIEALRRE